MLDRIDKKILETLQKHGRMTNADLSKKVGLSPTPCLARVKKLEENGTIMGYSARVNPSAVGLEICVYVLVQIDRHTRQAGDEFAQAVAEIASIYECHMISGKQDYLLRIFARDLKHYEELVKDQISELPHIVAMESLFVLDGTVASSALSIT